MLYRDVVIERSNYISRLKAQICVKPKAKGESNDAMAAKTHQSKPEGITPPRYGSGYLKIPRLINKLSRE